MHYKSTRGGQENISASQAILHGIAKDGGLFVPDSFPQYSYADLHELAGCTYQERAARIMADFLPEFSKEELESYAAPAYAPEKFEGGFPAPLSMLQNGQVTMYLLELWHGPTCAFKDMALQMLPYLLTGSLRKDGCGKKAVILVATSGDTGKAALEGFKDVDGVSIQVFYPESGVSDMQKRQMTTQEGGNVSVCAIQGNFDDAQSGVKKIFTDPQVNRILEENGMLFSSANSINWGRLLPQIVYYFSAYCDLMRTGEMDYEGEKINIVVPTGNFGNILAAYYAKKMGLPVNRFICASNSNNVLTEFIRTGVYDRNRQFYTTISPSMDILISSNLERLLYDLTGNNSALVASWMNQLAATGRYQVDAATLQKLQELFWGGFCDDGETLQEIREMFQTENYLCDTHTAVAVHVYKEYVAQTQDTATPTVIASTASPYKFASHVYKAVTGEDAAGDDFAVASQLSAVTGTQIPAPIASLQEKPVRFANVCTAAGMREEVLRAAGIR